MKKTILPLILLTSLLASCNQQANIVISENLTASNKLPTELLSEISSDGINKLANTYLEAKEKGLEKQFNLQSEAAKIVQEYPASKLSSQALPTYGDIASQVKDLYPAEKALCDTNGNECLLVLQAGGMAHATSASLAGWQTVTTDNERDAIRHSSWNGYMTISIGYTKAAQWANIHEYGNPKRAPNSLPEQMDLHNNSVGRNIALSSPVSLMPAAYRFEEVARQVKDGIKQGRMKILSDNKASLVASNTYSYRWPSNF